MDRLINKQLDKNGFPENNEILRLLLWHRLGKHWTIIDCACQVTLPKSPLSYPYSDCPNIGSVILWASLLLLFQFCLGKPLNDLLSGC